MDSAFNQHGGFKRSSLATADRARRGSSFMVWPGSSRIVPASKST